MELGSADDVGARLSGGDVDGEIQWDLVEAMFIGV